MAQEPKPLCALQHRREPWSGAEKVYVCGRWGALNGSDFKGENSQRKVRHQQLYEAAKYHGNYDAAQALVSRIVNDRVVDRLIDDATPFYEKNIPLLFITPHPPFNDDNGVGAQLEKRQNLRNALPHQYAAHLSEQLGGEIDTEIVQHARVGRTKLNKMQRILWQPSYIGAVRHDAAYILVDDVATTGCTLAALRSHIVGNGGTVCSITALAHGSGSWQPLALVSETWQKLETRFGKGLHPFWEREIGHAPEHLTEAEGRFLLKWAQGHSEIGDSLIQRLRDCLLETAGGFEREKGASGGTAVGR
jgi:hypothetical protein